MSDRVESLLLVTTAAGHEGACRRELERLVPGSRAEHLFLKGNLLLHSPLGAEQTVAVLDEAETVLIARVSPTDVHVRIGPAREHLKALLAAAQQLGKIDSSDSFVARCQRRGQHDFSSRDVEIAVGTAVAECTQARVDFDDPEWLLGIEIFQDIAYVGLFPADLFLRKQLQRTRKYPPGQRPLNRAQLKLEEIIERFELELPSEGRALDLGAAPGGWSKILARHMAEVVAVDPAELAPEVDVLPQVTHWRCRAEDLLERDDLGEFDLIANDMNREPTDSAELISALAAALVPGGLAVMTIKFFTSQRRRHIRDAAAILEREYTDLRVRRMPHNARETTVVMRRREN